MRQAVRIGVLVLAAALVVLAAGCGSSTNNASPTTASGPSGHSGPTGDGGFASGTNCAELAGIHGKIAATVSSTDNGNADPDSVTTTTQLQALADAAPPKVKADVQTVASAYAGYVKAVQDSGYDMDSFAAPTNAQITAFEKAVAVFGTAKVTGAVQHLAAWARQNCK